jgi:uncharacterized spore protein YtfJ
MSTSSPDNPKTVVQQIIQSIVDRLQSTATVKTVYGEPIETKGKVIIPVAKVAYGFGAGLGRGKKLGTEDEQSGSGAGGGVMVRPAGVLEITQEETRFIPIGGRGKLLGALLLGLCIGMFMAGACCRRGRRSESE